MTRLRNDKTLLETIVERVALVCSSRWWLHEMLKLCSVESPRVLDSSDIPDAYSFSIVVVVVHFAELFYSSNFEK